MTRARRLLRKHAPATGEVHFCVTTFRCKVARMASLFGTQSKLSVGCLTLGGAAVLLTIGAAAGLLVGRCGAETPTARPNVTEVRASPDVITAVRHLARLEGVVFYLERVVDVKEKQSRFFDLVQAEDAILLVAAGDVTAGVDLGALQPGDVITDPTREAVVITLPRATVFSRRIDNNRTYVHTRRTDTWAVRQEHLETRARQEAERTLEEAALQAGILKHAEESVGRTIESLLRSLGYRQVEIRFRDPGPDDPTSPPRLGPTPEARD